MVATPVGALKEPCDLRAPGDLGLFRVLEGDLLEEGEEEKEAGQTWRLNDGCEENN